jgi:hypothetical protein
MRASYLLEANNFVAFIGRNDRQLTGLSTTNSQRTGRFLYFPVMSHSAKWVTVTFLLVLLSATIYQKKLFYCALFLPALISLRWSGSGFATHLNSFLPFRSTAVVHLCH